MSFWTYMLHCRGGLFYVGHTDDLERRIGEHQSGLIAGFTADHLPVELVWSESFQTRDDAKAAEHKIKGWSQPKKLALIRGDWERISELAKNKDGGWPTAAFGPTSSAQTGLGESISSNTVRPEPVEGLSFSLQPHPETPPLAARAITARIKLTQHWLTLRWRIEGSGALVVPPLAGKGRADGLWQATCFELFLKTPDSETYAELNLSPSERWAAYDFDTYRAGMGPRHMPRDPVCTMRLCKDLAIFDAAVPLAGLPPLPWSCGLSAVIEEEGDRKSYWALAHAPGKPDFHAPTCFAATLPAPQRA